MSSRIQQYRHLILLEADCITRIALSSVLYQWAYSNSNSDFRGYAAASGNDWIVKWIDSHSIAL